MEHVLEFLGRSWFLWLLLFLYLAWRLRADDPGEIIDSLSPIPCEQNSYTKREKIFALFSLLALVLFITGVLHRL
jgi:hypothetical protein